MSKILVFTFTAREQLGGLGDLHIVYETDNREERLVVDSRGYLLPWLLEEIAVRRGAPSCIQALHLDDGGKPARQETWQRVSMNSFSPDDTEMLVRTSTNHNYLRLTADNCSRGHR